MRQPISIIIPPPQSIVIKGVAKLTNQRTFCAVDEFSAALAAAAGSDVPVVEGSLLDAPREGFLILYSLWEQDSFRALGPRTILFDVNRIEHWIGYRASTVMDQCNLAAAVGDERYYNWLQRRPEDGSGGLNGLVSVAERAGMEVHSFRSPDSDYGVLSCSHCRDLPSLLVHYLTVYEEMGLHLRG